jgi:hypothetical protein
MADHSDIFFSTRAIFAKLSAKSRFAAFGTDYANAECKHFIFASKQHCLTNKSNTKWQKLTSNL